jgi:ligand-binding sensor domain-containing protein/serine phosphatase RsbU (regulator of sigma subunit)
MFNRFLPYFFLFLCFSITCNAQNTSDELIFEHLSIKQGLSQGIVTGITQDAKGFMWFGTEDDLNRFDGYDFVHLENDPNNKNSMPDNWIRALTTDKNGDVWIGTDTKGIAKYDRKKDSFIHYPHKPNDANSVASHHISAILADSKNRIWVGTKDAGLCVLDQTTQKFIRYQYQKENIASLPDNNILTIYETKNGDIWLGTNVGLCLLNQEDGTFTTYRKGSIGLTDNEIRTICEDQNGILWLGTGSNGICKFDPKRNVFYNYSYLDVKSPEHNLLNKVGVNAIIQDKRGFVWIGTAQGGIKRELRYSLGKDKNGKEVNVVTEVFTIFKNSPSNLYSLSNNHIRNIFEDTSGVIWIGTNGGGINFYDPDIKVFKHYKHDAEDRNTLSNNTIRSVFEDSQGILWVGAIESGLDRFDRKNNTVKNYRYPQGLIGNTVSCIFEDSEGVMWFGTHGGGLNRFDRNTETFTVFKHNPEDENTISNNNVEAIREDKKGYLWIATDGGLNRFDKRTRTFFRFVNDPNNANSLPANNIQSNAFIIDKFGVLWIGTYNGGLTKYDPELRRFYHYKKKNKDAQSLCDDRVISLYEDNSSNIWIGTHGGGMCKFDRQTDTFTSFNTSNGMPNNEVYGILGDDRGNIWASTKNGLVKYNSSSLIFKTYYETDGLQSNVFYWGASYKSKKGEMFFGGTNGLNAFYPEKIKDNTYIPPIVITNFQILNKNIPIKDDSLHRDSPLKENITDTKEIELSFRQSTFSFEFSALNYRLSQKNQYAYQLEGFDEDWVHVDSKKRFAAYSNLQPGEYTFKVKASNNDGAWNSTPATIKIRIIPPIWGTLGFQFLAAILVISLLIGIYSWRISRIKAEQDELEAKIEAATAEIKAKNDELEVQKQEVLTQKENIQSSIKYAQRIQEAMLPLPEVFAEALPASFILFKPRDIVSGDFYWLHHDKHLTIVAAADCTGHGVPGAFMSMIGNDLLGQIVEHDDITSPELILNELNVGVRKALRQDATNNKDGMDVAICVINRLERVLEYAGAANPLYYIQDGDLKEIKADRFGIGGKQDEAAPRRFKKHTLLLDKPSTYYIFSDGYQDQFGGENNSKFMTKRLKQLFLDIYKKPMYEQKKIMDEVMTDWIKNTRQIDDILVIGFRL